jgi:SPX domain protein involved in polyphosphate accumulation
VISKTETTRDTSLEQLRYERKYLITEYSFQEVRQLLKFHPACFSEIFHERIVNNIYFDTLGFSHFYDNIDGSTERLKMRIRWYGNLFGEIPKPILEYKIKNGLMGKKDSYPLQSFSLNKNGDLLQFEAALSSLPKQVKDEMRGVKPSLLNSYTRQYFLSADKKFRITVDRHLCFYHILNKRNTLNSCVMDHSTTVMELKYDCDQEIKAKEVSAAFPFTMTKSSKYLQGLERMFI